MWNDPTITIVAWLPLLPVALVILSFLLHFLVFVWGSITSNFVYMSNLGKVIAFVIGCIGVLVVASLILPPMLAERMMEYPDEYQWTWSILVGVVAVMVAGIMKLLVHHLGRVIYINKRSGKIRFYSLARLLPWSKSRHIDEVEPLRFRKGRVDVWGLGTLEPLEAGTHTTGGATYTSTRGDISKASIQKMIHRTNAALSRYRSEKRN